MDFGSTRGRAVILRAARVRRAGVRAARRGPGGEPRPVRGGAAERPRTAGAPARLLCGCQKPTASAASENWEWLRRAIASSSAPAEQSQRRAAEAAILALNTYQASPNFANDLKAKGGCLAEVLP